MPPLAALLLLAVPASVDVELGPLFTDGAVLQRDVPLRIFGTGTPRVQVLVSIAGREVVTLVDDEGHWSVPIGPIEAGGPFELHVNQLVVRDVLVGEVWLCSGQSNMEWPLAWSADSETELAGASRPNLRLFKVPRAVADEPRRRIAEGTDIEGAPLQARWARCSPESARMFSAVGYYFGCELREALDVPVGLIHCAWGGTTAEAWTGAEVFATDATLAASRARTDLLEQNRPSQLFNGMLAPLWPYAFRGVIWYQGEANVGQAGPYRALFPALIRSWRETWGRPDMPFLFVQLAAFLPRHERPTESDWAELREAQAMTLTLPHTGMAVTIDIGDEADIHPRNKRDVGRRLGRLVRADVYGEEGLAARGPSFAGMSAKDGEVRVRLAHSQGLTARGGRPMGFALAGADRRWFWANARIEGVEVVLRSAEVPEPVAVRYAWADNPACNLYNGAGLPAVPFRTDDWQREE